LLYHKRPFMETKDRNRKKRASRISTKSVASQPLKKTDNTRQVYPARMQPYGIKDPVKRQEYLQERIRNQALIALTNAFATINGFFAPLYTPDISNALEKVQTYLIDYYSEGTSLVDGKLPV
jgi:hypothetical protein